MKAKPTLIESFHRFHYGQWDSQLVVHDIKLGRLTFLSPEAKPQNARQAICQAISAIEQQERHLSTLPKHIVARNPSYYEMKQARMIFELQYLNDLLEVADKILWMSGELVYH